MRNFAVSWAVLATRQVLKARAFLGLARAGVLDEEIDEIALRLSRHPEIGHPVQTKAGWSLIDRRVILSRTPYILFYRLNLERELVIVYALRHQRARPVR